MTDQLMAADHRAAELRAGVCRLYLVRHGTTTLNVENRYRGRRDIPLDAQGYQDAVDAARRLSRAGLAAVYTGPLRRTIATAQIIADEARVPDLRILHGLNNVDYGAWEGLTAEEAAMFDPHAFALYRESPSRAANHTSRFPHQPRSGSRRAAAFGARASRSRESRARTFRLDAVQGAS